MTGAALVWFQQDLRLADNPALDAATRTKSSVVIPVYIWSPREEGEWRPGAASRWWLHKSLASLDAGLRKRGSRLLLMSGDFGTVLPKLAKDCGASVVFWNRRYEPAAIAREKAAPAAAQAVRELSVATQCEGSARLARGPHRSAVSGRRHARALGNGMDAQPSADDRCVFSR